jgi:hypothetical protein
MSICLHSKTRKAARLLNLAVCVVSVLMMLAFPMRSAHQFGFHFRTPEVRRSIERNTAFANPEPKPSERIPYQAVRPALFVLVDTGDAPFPIAHVELSSNVDFPRLLLRLKLGSSRSGSQDPLL